MNPYIIIIRLAENLERLPDETLKISVAEVNARYTAFAERHGFKVASKEKLGQALNHLFDNPDLRSFTVEHVKGNWYMGMSFRADAIAIKNVGEIMLPLHAHAEFRAPYFILEVYTRYEVDDTALKMIIELDTTTNQYTIMVNGYKIEDVRKYGFTGTGRLTQNWISGMALACREIYVCRGMDILVRPDSSVMIARSWKDTYQLFSPEETRWHSKKCEVLLTITKNAKTEACRKCSHDLRQVINNT